MSIPLLSSSDGAVQGRIDALKSGRKLTLAEIAAIDGAGVAAVLVRKWYDPDFGTDRAEDPAAPNLFRVTVEYREVHYRSETYEVRAHDGETAERIGRARFDRDGSEADECEIDDVAVEQVLQ